MRKQKIITGYKSVKDDLSSGYGNCKWRVGEWKKHDGDLKLCNSGFHASRHPYDVLNYLQGNRLFIVEAKGDVLDDKDKFVAKEMRLKTEIKDLKRLSVEFAVWNARKCLKNFEKKHPDDKRPRQAIEAAEKYLLAKTSAARSAARSAAESAAWSAASAAWSAARKKFVQLCKKYSEKRK